MKEFENGVAVITGGASGIGRGMAQALASEGMKLVLADVEPEPLSRATRELADAGASVIGVPCDVAQPESIEALRDRALSQFGAVHVVVALSESLFAELGGRGLPIGVSVLCPGWVRTRILESERNRPEAPRPDPGERAPEVEAVQKLVEGFIRDGLDPIAVGRLVVESIRADRFYVLTHPHWKNMIQHRMENILEGRDPTGVAPAGAEEDWSALLERE